MKKKSARLKPVEELAEKRVKSATEDMVSARSTHHTHEQKLAELVQYRFEYIEQFQMKGKEGIQSSQLQQYQQFISQLEVAISQQKMVVARANDDLDRSQIQWRDKNSHKKAINKVVSRFRKQENSDEERKEQTAQDERSTQIHNQKNKNH